MNIAGYVACICEGAAEQAIIELLLEEDKLIFSAENLLDNKIIRCRDGKTFENTYLRKGFEKKITVLRILDSRRENFKLSKAYIGKIEVINIITAPEIEMLIIFKENKYTEYKKSKMKPSEFCISILEYKDVKSHEFIKNYFSDVNQLIECIRKYRSKSRIKREEVTLFDLLK